MTNVIDKTKNESVKPVKKRNSYSGSKSSDFTNILATQTSYSGCNNYSDEESQEMQDKACFAALLGIKPTDEVEGMMAAQMVALHNASMECFRRAMLQGATFDGRSMNLKHAAKLTNCYSSMVNTLQKYRGKGRQKMTVEHVTVNDGGQAIVGNVESSK